MASSARLEHLDWFVFISIRQTVEFEPSANGISAGSFSAAGLKLCQDFWLQRDSRLRARQAWYSTSSSRSGRASATQVARKTLIATVERL